MFSNNAEKGRQTTRAWNMAMHRIMMTIPIDTVKQLKGKTPVIAKRTNAQKLKAAFSKNGGK